MVLPSKDDETWGLDFDVELPNEMARVELPRLHELTMPFTVEMYFTPHDVNRGKNQLLIGIDKLNLAFRKNEFKWNAPLEWKFERKTEKSPLALANVVKPGIRQHFAGCHSPVS